MLARSDQSCVSNPHLAIRGKSFYALYLADLKRADLKSLTTGCLV